MPRMFRHLARAARDEGWSISYTGSGHLRWISPEGERVIRPSAPGKQRAYLYLRAALRRAGLSV